MPVDLDPPTKAIMATLAADGFVVSVGHDDHGRVVVEARDQTGETWQVWEADAYAVVCELAGQVGFDLGDG